MRHTSMNFHLKKRYNLDNYLHHFVDFNLLSNLIFKNILVKNIHVKY